MRKQQKQKAEELVRQMEEAHDQLKKYIEQGSTLSAMELLEECQNGGITLGTLIENTEGEAHPTVSLLEEYCELAYQIHEQLSEKKEMNTNKTYKLLRKKLIKISNSLKNDVRIRIEVAFFPYKASMWDSLESVYLEAKEDSDCDAYCVPIPYYDMNPDRSFGQMHYEGEIYPKEIEITDWQKYDFEERKPDVIFIHNIYDNYNLVTSVHPRYYSGNLKQYTERLVYIPYYMTSGGMSEGQGFCPSYMNADYIVIQSPKIRKFFDARIPDEKFLPFGSPKADRVIRKCQNPPDPPKEWNLSDAQLEKMSENKVYFYNTSIGGMLADTENFLKKMRYVFKCFEGRENACILWRPHPLLEATFRSMRSEYEQEFYKLKKYFVEKEIGILDATADIEDAIALSDAYIGDAGTSVTALFGVAGKPVFILNNKIHNEPEEEDWRAEITLGFKFGEQDRYAIKGKKLYVSESYQYNYKYCCDLSDDESIDNYYSVIKEVNGKKYACCAAKSQDILSIDEDGARTKIKFRNEDIKAPAFGSVWKYKDYLLLIPVNYPAVVRYNTVSNEIVYFDKYIDRFTGKDSDQKLLGPSWVYQGYLYIASPTDNNMYELSIEDGNVQIVEMDIKNLCGFNSMVEYQGNIWLMPYEGKGIACWNPDTGETKEYTNIPSEFMCCDPISDRESNKCPFETLAFDGDYIYLTPLWGNMYLKLNLVTGEFVEWQLPFGDITKKDVFDRNARSCFLWDEHPREDGHVCQMYSYATRQLFQIDMQTKEYDEIKIHFDVEELRSHEAGFCECSEKLRYACMENSFNSIKIFLDGKVAGSQFDRNKQIQAYKDIIVNLDGNCGKEIYDFLYEQVSD